MHDTNIIKSLIQNFPPPHRSLYVAVYGNIRNVSQHICWHNIPYIQGSMLVRTSGIHNILRNCGPAVAAIVVFDVVRQI